MTFKLLHLDFSDWPICQWPNQCGLPHNELLIFLIPSPKAAKIYQNTISSFLLPCSFLIPQRMDGEILQEPSMVGCPGVPLLHSVSAWSLAQPVNRRWSGSAMYNSIMQPFHGQRTPTVLIQTPPKGQTQTKRSAKVKDFILSNCLFNLKRCLILELHLRKIMEHKTELQVWSCVKYSYRGGSREIISLKPTILQVQHIVSFSSRDLG